MDVFKEFIVKKDIGTRERLSIMFIMIGAVALGFSFIGLLFGTPLRSISVLLALGCGFGGWKLITKFFIEYEYILTNKDLDIDKITNQSTRKRLCTIDMTKVSEYGKITEELSISEDETVVQAVANNAELVDYYLRFDHKDHGKTILLFTPSTELMDLIKTSVPRSAKGKL